MPLKQLGTALPHQVYSYGYAPNQAPCSNLFFQAFMRWFKVYRVLGQRPRFATKMNRRLEACLKKNYKSMMNSAEIL
jgi:hypothetical protein